jgi:hypothetical protein
MTREDIDTLWQKALQESVKAGEQFTRYHFAALIAAAERQACVKILHDNATKSKGMAVHALIASAQQIEARSERTKKTYSALHSDDMIQP